MMKKLLSFVCCLLPVGAGAVTVNSHTPGANASYGGNGNLTSVNVDANTVEVITNGNGIVISQDSAGASGGLTVTNDLIVGQDYSEIGGNLYAEAATNTPFTIQSDGNISVGAVLQVLTGRRLDITPKTTDAVIDASFGSVDAQGALNIQNVNQFKSVGSVDSATALTIYANTIDAGAINVTGGTSDIKAVSVESGNIQNGANAGAMTIKLTGDLTTKNKSGTNIGSIENSGASMTINAQNVTVAGTMKNDSPNGTLKMNVAGLSINGGGPVTDTNTGTTTIAPSFVNAGNLNLTVTGATDIAYGFDLSGMATTNTFSLTTGTLNLASELTGANVTNALAQVFHNNLNSFELTVTDGIATTGTIINGATNAAANMAVSGKFVDAASVTNYGTLNINATGTPDGTDDPTYALNITGDVESMTGTSVTNIISASSLNVGGAVSNAGAMLINGRTINLAGVVNDGGTLNIKALTDASGVINISSTVKNNSGTMTINARQIDIGGVVTNVDGTTTISGSDGADAVISLGGINVQGGRFDLDAKIGAVSVDNAMDVQGGVLNIGQNTHKLTVGSKVTIAGNVELTADAAATGAGNVNIAASGAPGFILTSTATDETNGVIQIDGDVSAVADDLAARSAQFDAQIITVGGNVAAENQGKLIFGLDGRQSKTTIDGSATANNGGTLEFYSDDTDVGALSGDGLFLVHGSQITANTGAINIDGNLLFSPEQGTGYTSGMLVSGTDALTLQTLATGADIYITGGATITADNTLTLDSARDATISGLVSADGALSVTAVGNATFENTITTNKSLTVYARNIETKSINNTGNMLLGDAQHIAADISTGAITNSGTVTINGVTVKTTDIESTAGAFDVTANSLNSTFVTISGGTATLDVAEIVAENDISVSGNLFQGTPDASNIGMLNIVRNNATVTADNLHVGSFNALNKSVVYELAGDITVDNNFAVSNGATVEMAADGDMTLTNGALTNDGNLTLTVGGTGGLSISGAIENTGNLTLSALNADIKASSFTVNTGKTTLAGQGMELSGAFGAADKSSMLYHGGAQTLNAGDFRITNSDYTLTASNVALAGIKQTALTGLTINTSDLKIANDIDVVDMRVAANPSDNWLNVDVGGSVLGGAQFIGLESMYVGGNYQFTNNSQINAAILPDATPRNYWSTVSLKDDNTLGQITNAEERAGALIQVGGAFVSSADAFNVATNGGALARPQVGLVLRDIVDPGTAIWLLHADGGVSDDTLAGKIRNLNVSFCNADGTECFDYLGALKDYNGTDPKADLPAYISVRDSAGDGFADSLYVVFDPRFGGPVEVFKIQPIVARTDDYTSGEYMSAGAIDDLIAGQLAAHGFYNRTPIEAIPLIFKNTNMSTAANELYNRMEYYNLDRDGAGLARFSRLFQPREVEQIAGSVVLNEHTNFRSFEDRMFDEFIWNRNRNLKKAWLDVDYGIFYQDATDGKHVDGNRFNISGGFDWQESQTLLLGLTGRVSRTSSDNSDSMDLGYMPGQHIAGHVKTRVADTDIGLGGYLIKTLGQKMRVYGNGFLDIHVFDVKREQNYVSKISGTGTAFSLMSEWGLLHDWLNQYVVGNLYTRVGYNFGFDVTERAAGQDYMNLKSDGYFTFTPGYSLTAQKRIYPSVWFQVRPYATIGVEYDVLGAPDSVKYKFAVANSYTTYDVNIDPLWANIGGGVEMLSVTGIQVGIDYRYQYNQDIQMHNIRLSGSYRF